MLDEPAKTAIKHAATPFMALLAMALPITAEQTSEDRHNLNVLFSWQMKKNVDLYLLFNDYETGSEDVHAAFLKLVYRF